MLAYAPQRRAAGVGQQSRKTLMLVVIGHVALVAVALTTKMTIDIVRKQDPTWVRQIPLPPPPPEPNPRSEPRAHQISHIQTAPPVVPVDHPLGPVVVDPGPSIPTGPIVGPAVDPQPLRIDPPYDPVKVAAVLRTPGGELRPPYPPDKLRAEEEATLKLRLTIDENGRVIAVDPVGKADPSFLAAARRHLMRSWRYKPATLDGVATITTTVISLSFRLEDA